MIATTVTLLSQQLTAALLSVVLGSAPATAAQDEIRDAQWHLDFLDIATAHTISTGEGVIVGVVDTGVDGDHPDLAGQLLPGADFSIEHLPDALVDRDGHGTAMAGLIAAKGRTLGIAPGSTILPVRKNVFGDGLAISTPDAIDWAVDHGATVLCLAFGSTGYEGLEAAIARAVSHDVMVVAAVGNAPDEPLQFPAAYSGVVGVAGVGPDGDHAPVSVVSPTAVLAAPAVEVMSTESLLVVPSGYAARTGTSDATAIVAGVAALVRSAFPDLSAEEVIHRMTYTADDRGAPGRDDQYGYGIVNPVAALTADVPLLHPPDGGTGGPTPGGGGSSTRTLVVIVGVLVAVWLIVLVVGGLVLARRR